MGLDIGSVANRVVDYYRDEVAARLRPDAESTVQSQPSSSGCGCGSAESIPGYPAKPPTDPGAGEHGSQPWYSRGDDVLFEQVAQAAADGADLVGYTNAARHLQHYLNNSGEDLQVDPERIARDVPAFEQSVQQQLNGEVDAAVQQAIEQGCYGEPIPFESDWQGFYIDKGMSEDWFYAMGGIQHSVTGYVVVSPGDPPTAEVHYQYHVFDRYNWDEGKSVTIGGVTITDKQMGELHTAGLAQEYDVVGSSGDTTYTATVDPNGGVSGDPEIPEAGDREGERSDPGR